MSCRFSDVESAARIVLENEQSKGSCEQQGCGYIEPRDTRTVAGA